MSKDNSFSENKDIKSKLVFGNICSNKIDLSIVIPTYKRIDLLRKCIKAIISQEKSKHEWNYEVIVISNDPDFDYKSLDLMLDPNVFKIYVNEKNLGMCGNMNRCAQLAKGNYVAYIQDDDVLLPNYVHEVLELILSNNLKDIDWLIPNRYYLMTNMDKKSQFGKKAIRNMKIKRGIAFVLRFGKKTPMYQFVSPYETLVTTYPFYAGGPTCGMVFNKDSLISSGGFKKEYPYGFDYAFFMDFSRKFKVALYNRYLSIYITSESASNRPEVQFDFFRARYYSLEKYAKEYGITNAQKDVLHYITYKGYPEKTKELIDKEFSIKPISRSRVLIIKICCMLKTYKSGGYRRMPCPNALIEWYNQL